MPLEKYAEGKSALIPKTLISLTPVLKAVCYCSTNEWFSNFGQVAWDSSSICNFTRYTFKLKELIELKISGTNASLFLVIIILI